MAIKRLTQDSKVLSDSIISGINPMRQSDPPGVYLGSNPLARTHGQSPMYITYWEACEIATKIGYPMPEVYDAQRAEIDAQATRIAQLEAQLQSAVHDLQMKAISTEVKNMKKELLNALEGYTGAVRGVASGPVRNATRVGPGGSDSLAAAGKGKSVLEGKRPTL